MPGENAKAVPLSQTSSKLLSPKPFLKWAGGKKQLLPELVARVPEEYECYFEPFVGGGAMFFELGPRRAYVLDINTELINCYKVIKSEVDQLIEDLAKHVYEHDYFYAIRNVDRTPEYERWSAVRRASRLIYLNKSCFNGLYRVNSNGQFNVPFGRYKNPKILDENNLRACSRALKKTRIVLGSFVEMEQEITNKDFVYFDPPYAPLNETSYFTSYTDQGFGESKQRELADLCTRLDKRGIRFMVSNSHTPLILGLYERFNVSVVRATRAINSKGDRRGKIKEVIVTNY